MKSTELIKGKWYLLENNSNLQIGDSFKVIGFGVNNSKATQQFGKLKNIYEKNYKYIVKNLHNDDIFQTNNLGCGTIETECGKFIWNEAKSLQKIEKIENSPIYEIY